MDRYKSQSLILNEQPLLFEHYLRDFSKVSEYFVWHPEKDLEKCARIRLTEYQNREKIVDILRIQNSAWKASPQTLKNIDKLMDPGTLAVVTGQQAGIFGGPLYTVYKIIQCIKTAEYVEKRYKGQKCVPVFWMEVGDSDFREINHINILNLKNELMRFSLSEDSEDQRSVYLRSLSTDLLQIYEHLAAEFPQNDFRDNILEQLKNIYAPGKNLADAFADWIHSILKNYGVIIINPTEPEVAKLSHPLLTKALKGWRQLNKLFEDQNRKLTMRGYHTQISLDPQQTLLFYRAEQDRRCRLDGEENHDFILKGSQKTAKITENFLAEEMKQSADKFTPNVAFRPIVQDYLLPSIIYIGGPAEISYAAQLLPLYEYFNVTPAVFHPRIRATLIEEKVDRSVEKLGLKLADFFKQRNKIIDYQIDQNKDQKIDDSFHVVEMHLQEEMQTLKELLIKIDPTLNTLIDKTGQSMRDSLNRLQNKVGQAYQRKMQIEINQMNKVLVNLFPDDKFQERVLNIVQYLVKYGPEFIPKLYETLDHENWDHQLIYL
ncbi:MAG: bacillithiol biosynthesis cysteine-adding enzyme BshC [bacterium]|nr:MAG: bacillithiol biosynthesis cysteine-adding enzyme BshC [bacterium]